MATLTFSAHGFRWRVHVLAAQAMPPAESVPGANVTGLYFESDDADSRFLPFTSDLLPSDSQLAGLPMDELARLLSWAKHVR